MKAYTEKIISDNIVIRTFRAESAHLYEWHRDEEDRHIEVLSAGEGWKLQIDNHLPELMTPGEAFSIKKLVFHRLIAGTGELQVKIIKS